MKSDNPASRKHALGKGKEAKRAPKRAKGDPDPPDDGGDDDLDGKALVDKYTWLQNHPLKQKNTTGFLFYRSRYTGITCHADTRQDRNWELKEKDKANKHLFYPDAPDKAMHLVLEPNAPVFIRKSVNEKRQKLPWLLTMACNGMTVEQAWTDTLFAGLIFAGTNYHSQADTPIVSLCQGGYMTMRNTGPSIIKMKDTVVYVPPKMYVDHTLNKLLPTDSKETQSSPYEIKAQDDKKHNGLFLLMPMELEKAVDYFLECDKSLKGKLSAHIRKTQMAKAAEEIRDLLNTIFAYFEFAEKRQKQADSKLSDQEDEKRCDDEVKDPKKMEAIQTELNSEKEQLMSREIDDKQAKLLFIAHDIADTLYGHASREEVRRYLLQNFFAGDAIQGGDTGALFVLQVFGSRNG
jgi:hypothetical protein